MYSTIQNKWQDILMFIKTQFDVMDISYTSWVEPLKPYTLVNDKLYVLLGEANDNETVKTIVSRKYTDYLAIAIQKVTGIKATPVFILSSETADISKMNTSSDQPAPPKDDFNELIKRNGLNPNFTFYNFVSGASNSVAHAASLAVAENPGREYKLLYLYGGVGLGKTHLMHAIAIYILKNNPSARVLYTTSENFINEYINSIKNGTPEAFRNKYRSLDVLLVDDIQFFADKDNTQEEFFNTFNSLYNNNKQIVVSSDKPPRDINNLEERIKSRFEGGLIADIQPPNFETRMAILRKKEEVAGYNIDDEVIKYIATNIKSNIRTLEGALSRIALKAKLENVPVNAETAAVILKDVINNSSQGPEKILPKKIISVVSEHYHLKESDIISPKRNKELAHPRQIIMYLCCIMTDSTLNEIGEALGNRDHATVIHGRDKISEDLKKNESLKNDIEILKKKIT